MSHDAHESHPGYSPAQVLCDQCGECADRSKRLALAIGWMDADTFTHAWQRAAEFGKGHLDDPSEAEVPLLDILYAVQMQLWSHGLPVGELPRMEALA